MKLLLQTNETLTRDERFRALYDTFSKHDSGAAWSIVLTLLLVAAFLAVLVLAAFWQRRTRNEPTARPLGLLWELAGRAALAWYDRVLLLRLARRLRLEAPAAMLLSTKYFDGAVEQWLTASRGVGAARLARIRERLFPESDPD